MLGQALFELTHGWTGLMSAYGSVQVPMWAAMARRRATLNRWIASPAWAAALTVALGAGIAGAEPLLHVLGPASALLRAASAAGCSALTGYVAGGALSSVRPSRPVQQVRGAVVREASAPARRLRERPGAERARVRGSESTALTLAGVPIATVDETKHFKIIGATGAGKSTAITELLGGALSRGDRAVIADPDGGYARRFFDARRGDVVLSPFEPAGRRWDLFGEISEPYDIEQLALALIPDHQAADRSWRGYARTLFSAVAGQARAAGVSDVGELYDLLVVSDGAELRLLAGGTPAQPFFEEHNARMLDSIRSVTSSAIGALQYVARQSAPPLSVREWVRSGSGVLFIPYRAGQIAALRSSISAWMRLAIFQSMSSAEGGRPLWFIVDELDALGPIDGLKDALARLRKFGGRCVLGFQSIAQVSTTYGAGEAQTIVENCGNTLILRASASEHGGTARFASRLIGEREIIRLTRTRSRRAGEIFPSVSETEHWQVEPAVMDAQIERLADLSGFLKLASEPDWQRVRLQRSAERHGRCARVTAGSDGAGMVREPPQRSAASLEDECTHG